MRRPTASRGRRPTWSSSCAARSTADTLVDVKPNPDRLYGRQRGPTLRPRQRRLLELALPRLRFDLDRHATAPLDAFDGASRLWVEIGFGGGEHAEALVARHPDIGLIACEVFDNTLCSLLSRLVGDGAEATFAPPPRLRLWDADGRALLRSLPEASIERLYLMFPDPWPKARHAKRRFVHPDNVQLAARVLAQGGQWRIASDDPTYQAWVDEVMGAQGLFDALPASDIRPDGWPPTRYEAKALAAGRQPRYWTFVRNSSPVPPAP